MAMMNPESDEISPPQSPPQLDTPVSFSVALYPSIPLHFLQSIFEFLAKHSLHFFLSDSSQSDVVSLFNSVKDKILAAAPSSASADYRAPNKDNGLDLEHYTWGQTPEQVVVTVIFPPGTKPEFLANKIMPTHLTIGLEDQPPVISGSLYMPIKPEDCYWSLEDRQILTVHLAKYEPLQWWPCVVKGEPEIDTQKIKSEVTKVGDFDTETRMALEKIIFDERQRDMGRLTIDEKRKQEFLRKFLDEHPEMDFLMARVANRMGIR